MKRNYDSEANDSVVRRYACDFDTGVMHGYFMRSFEPFLRPGNVLELGSFRGDFTQRLLDRFDDGSCVVVSGEALEVARARFGSRFSYCHDTLEEAGWPHRYDNVVLTKDVEPLGEPVAILKRIAREWLLPRGRGYLI